MVIDEEQRFGVTHKERLKEFRSQVDVLTLTATPIPRTMQMAMSGLREISIIATPPADRLAIRTFLCHWDPDAAARGDPEGAGARGAGVLRAQPGAGPGPVGGEGAAAGARGQGGHGPRADGRRRAGEGDDRLRRRAVRRAVLDHHHRVGPGHPPGQHDDRQPRRPLRAGAAVPDARAHRPLARAGVLLPGGAGRGGAVGRGQAAAGGPAAVHRAGRRLPGGHPRPGDPRGGRPAGRAAARPGGGGRLRHLRDASWRRRWPSCAGSRSSASRIRRSRSTCRRSCPTTTSPTPASGWSCTGGWPRRADEDQVRGTWRRSSTATGRCPRRRRCWAR